MYTSIVVGISTYIVIFHLNSLVYQASSVYAPMRNKIIFQMKYHGEGHWASKGRQFTTFQPKHDRPRPSEWWILLFWVGNLFSSLYRFVLRRPRLAHTNTKTFDGIVFIGDPDEAAPEREGTSTSIKEEASTTTMEVPSLSHGTNDPPVTNAQSPPTTERKTFPFQMRFLKKHNSGLKSSRASADKHEEV
jgi:hypothetical protein